MSLDVRLLRPRYYNGVWRKEGETITLTKRRHFKPRSMRWVEKPPVDKDEERLKGMSLEDLRAEAKKLGIAVPSIKGNAWGPNRIRHEILRKLEGIEPSNVEKAEEEVDDTPELEELREQFRRLGGRPDLRWNAKTLKEQIAKHGPRAISQMTGREVAPQG